MKAVQRAHVIHHVGLRDEYQLWKGKQSSMELTFAEHSLFARLQHHISTSSVCDGHLGHRRTGIKCLERHEGKGAVTGVSQ